MAYSVSTNLKTYYKSVFGLTLAVLVLAACEFPGGPAGGKAEGGGAELVVLLPGTPVGASRAVSADDTRWGAIYHPNVQKLLTYEINVTGPGEPVTKTARWDESIEFNLEPGNWTVKVNAFFRNHKNSPANASEVQETVTLTEGQTKPVSVTLDLHPDFADKVLIPDAETFVRIGKDPTDGGWLGQKKYFLLINDLELDNWKGPAIQGDAYATPQLNSFFDGGGHKITIRSFDTEGGNFNCGLFIDAWLVD
ncbi:MAG: hypothetical protein LBS57_09870, partial [Treponema sp.]|nr:hypothetical protein [Treponema sp.]